MFEVVVRGTLTPEQVAHFKDVERCIPICHFTYNVEASGDLYIYVRNSWNFLLKSAVTRDERLKVNDQLRKEFKQILSGNEIELDKWFDKVSESGAKCLLFTQRDFEPELVKQNAELIKYSLTHKEA
jgi:hypothetical protein